ncbi:hypothetical protein MMC11_002756 [Xylographa trunciseda]|nr:hypothetical protein [Xylographa trunciseda]
MDDLNISKSILSISAPGVYLVPDNNALAIQLARNVNIYASELKRELPDKFGFWASLPLPDVNGSLAEVAYALDTLHADGIILLTNYLGTYLGAPAFEPLFAELNHRHVPVFIHPQVPATAPSAGPIPATPLLWPPAVFEFEFDIARALVNLFYTQTIARYPNITYIVAHAGGALPPLVERVGSALAVFGIQIPGVDAAALKVALRSRFYFDLAGWPFPEPIQGLLPYVSARQLTYGSDYPFTPLGVVEGLGTVFDECLPRVFGSEEAREAVEFGNAERLLGGAGEGLEEGLG